MSSAARQIMARAVAWAESQQGTTETPLGSNHVVLTIGGIRQSLWGYVMPSFDGSPWCAATITAAYLQQGVDLRKLFANRNSFYCPTLRSMAVQRGVWRTGAYSPNAGDMVLQGTSQARPTHVEMAAPAPGSYAGYRTVGGNTSPGNRGSQSNGGGLYVRVRSRGVILGWIDMEALLDQGAAQGLWRLGSQGASTVPAAKPAPTPARPAFGWRIVDGGPDRGVYGPCSVDAFNRALAAGKAGADGQRHGAEREVWAVEVALDRLNLLRPELARDKSAGTSTQEGLDRYRDLAFPAWPVADRRGPGGPASLNALCFDAGIRATWS